MEPTVKTWGTPPPPLKCGISSHTHLQCVEDVEHEGFIHYARDTPQVRTWCSGAGPASVLLEPGYATRERRGGVNGNETLPHPKQSHNGHYPSDGPALSDMGQQG